MWHATPGQISGRYEYRSTIERVSLVVGRKLSDEWLPVGRLGVSARLELRSMWRESVVLEDDLKVLYRMSR